MFQGIYTALVTPFTQEGKIDFNSLETLIEKQISAGVDGLVLLGTTAEAATMDEAEKDELLCAAIKQINKRVKVIIGTGTNCTATTLKNSKAALRHSPDGILVVTPYYNKTSQQGLVKHFTYVADRFDVPMILYNVPGRTSIGIQPETYLELSKHPNINGAKEASGDISLFIKTRALCGDALNIWSGNDDQTVPMMAMGAKGVISVMSNIMPEMMSKMCQLCLDGDISAAADLQLQYNDLMNKLFIEVNPIPVKTAMNLLGYDVGDFRLPLCEMAPQNLEKLKASMRAAGLKV